MTTNTTPSGADALLQLIESYVEKRHTHGAPQYNVVTARARDAVLATLAAAEAQAERDALKAELERIKALEPVAWCLGNPEFADSSNVFLANEFTPDGEHEDEWTALYALWSKTA